MAYFRKTGLDNIYKSYCSNSKDTDIEENDNNRIFVSLKNNRISVFSEKKDLEQPIYRHKANELDFEVSHPDEVDHLLLNLQTLYSEELFTFKVEESSLPGENGNKKFYLDYLKDWPGNEVFVTSKGENTITISEFFLCIIEDLFDPDSDFNTYNRDLCTTYRTTFQNSKVFDYIYKKRNFYKALWEYEEAGTPPKEDNHYFFELKKNYDEYLELLLKDEILKYIPYDKFKNSLWFLENPEDEIYNLSKGTPAQIKKPDHEKNNVSNYLLRKHDIIRSIDLSSEFNWLNKAIGSLQIFIFVILLYLSWFFWSSESKHLFIDNLLPLIFLSLIALVLFGIIICKINYNLLLIRLSITIITSWLFILNLIDFTSSLLVASGKIVIFIVVFIIILIFISILGEINKESKYFSKKSSKALKQAVYIFIFAFNVSYIAGLAFHAFVTTDFIKKNKIIPEIIHSHNNHMRSQEKENFHLTKLENLINESHPDSILTLQKLNSIMTIGEFRKFNTHYILPIKIDTVTYSDLEKILYLNKDTTFLFTIRRKLDVVVYFRMFFIQIFMAMAFGIIVQSLLSKETVTEPI